MKFTPETLIQIYMDGSFTEEAQAEFDKLMRQDPLFAEKVTQAVAERVGPAPEPWAAQIEINLDSKIQGVWEKNKPSPLGRTIVKAAWLLLAVFLTGGAYWGLKDLFHPSSPAPASVKPVLSLKEEGDSATADTSKTGSARQAGAPGKGTAVDAEAMEDKFEANASARSGSSKNKQAPIVVSQVSKAPLRAQAKMESPANPLTPTLRHPGGSSIQEPPDVSTSSQAGTKAPLSSEGDALRVSIETQKTQRVEVAVLDPNHVLIRHLYKGVWDAGIHLVDWDGKDGFGNQVVPGDYTIQVNAGGKKMSGVVTIKPGK